MGVQSSLQVTLYHEAPPAQVLDSLLRFGWSLNCDGQIWYLPLGDDNRYDWQTREFTPDHQWLGSLIEDKCARSEIIGVGVCWQTTSIGGQLLANLRPNTLSILPTMNRQCLAAAPRYTDHSWYLARLIPALLSTGFQVLGVVASDFD